MKPANFPGRKLKRQQGALDRFKVVADHPAKITERTVLYAATLGDVEASARAARTKKRRAMVRI